MATKYLNQDKYRARYKQGDIAEPNKIKETNNSENPEYFLKWAEYIFAQYTLGYCQWGNGGMSGSGKSFEELRLYALGRQDNRKYKKWVDDCDPNATEGFMNINWDNVQILPKFRDIVCSKMDVEFEVRSKAVDATADKERKTIAGKMKLATNPAVKEMFAATGGMPPGVSVPAGINTPEDVDILQRLGGLTLQYEIAMADAMEYTRDESSWMTLKKRWRQDIFDLNACAGKVYTETSTRTVKIRYVDPAQLICSATKDPAHEDITFAGELRRMTLSDLRLESGLNEEQLMEIARLYKGFRSNATSYDSPYYSASYQTVGGDKRRSNTFENFEVDVVDFCFIGSKTEKYVMAERRDGTPVYDKVLSSSQLSARDLRRGKQMEETEIEYVYTCKWIVGTDIVFDYGKEHGIVRYNKKGVKRVRLPYIISSDRSPSMAERCISHIDDIQLAVLKKRNALAKMAPGPRMILDKTLLRATIDIGGKTMTMLDMVRQYQKTGVMVVESKPEFDDPDSPGTNKKPFEFAPTGLAEDFAIFAGEIGGGVDMIRTVTGVNEVADGSSQQPDMLVGVATELGAATNNAIKPLLHIDQTMTLNSMKYVTCKWQVGVLTGDIEIEYMPINSNVMRAIKLSGDLYDRDLGIILVIAPSETDRQIMLQDIMTKRMNSTISEADYMMIYNMVRDGDFKKAQLYLVRAVEEEKARQQQMAMQNLQSQAQAQSQAAQEIEAAKAKTLQLEYQLKAELIKVTEEEKRKTLQVQLQLQGQNQQLQAQNKLQGDIVSKTVDATIEQQNKVA